jgi:Family of unknown function (DUF6352)
VTLLTGAEFWLTSGFHLLQQDDAGRLKLTPEFLRAYLMRPELQPDERGDPAERVLAERFLVDPMQPIASAAVAATSDPDLRHNWEALLRFRDLLLNTDTIEEAYTRMAAGTAGQIAPLFFDHLVHAILRGLLDGCTDPIRVRAAELMFRTQLVAIEGSTIRVGDEEMIMAQADAEHAGEVKLDLLTPAEADRYWARSDRFDLALEIGFGSAGLDALCRVLESWLTHMAGIAGTIQPVQSIRDERWRWHIGLDADANEILNDLYRGIPVTEERLARLLSLFRMELAPSPRLLPEMSGRAIYLGMAMTERGRLRLKPQNLLLNLPWQKGQEL